MLQDFPDLKDQLVEWACQEHLEKKVCLESPAHRGFPAYRETKERKGIKDRQACLASEFRDGLGTREIKE